MKSRHLHCRATSFIMLLSAIFAAILAAPALAANEESVKQSFADEQLAMRVMTRTTEQLAAFYTGRGFNKAAIDAITQTCFVGGFVKNKTYDILWMTLDDWVFTDAQDKRIQRIRRNDWQPIWEKTQLAQSYQSTFSWTLLPDERDLRPDEHSAGNIPIPWQDEPFKLVANFKTGADKNGTPRTLTFENLTCRK